VQGIPETQSRSRSAPAALFVPRCRAFQRHNRARRALLKLHC